MSDDLELRSWVDWPRRTIGITIRLVDDPQSESLLTAWTERSELSGDMYEVMFSRTERSRGDLAVAVNEARSVHVSWLGKTVAELLRGDSRWLGVDAGERVAAEMWLLALAPIVSRVRRALDVVEDPDRPDRLRFVQHTEHYRDTFALDVARSDSEARTEWHLEEVVTAPIDRPSLVASTSEATEVLGKADELLRTALEERPWINRLALVEAVHAWLIATIGPAVLLRPFVPCYD